MNWQLNKIQYPIYNLGEGKRIGIWVQGCSLACKACVNRTLWTKKGGKCIPIIEIYNWILTLNEEFDGITISGGEPFQQYEPLITFLHLIKTRTNLTVHCFSGYYLKELYELFPDKLFCKYLDYLVDGRYIQEKHDDENVKGSSNQTFYKFINEIPVEQCANKVIKKWSIHVSMDNQIYMAGIPKKNDLNVLCNTLSEVGIKKIFK